MERLARALLGIVCVCVGCEQAPAGDAAGPAGPRAGPVEVPQGDALYALGAEQRVQLFDALAASLEAAPPDEVARQAGELERLATAIVRLGGGTGHLERARKLLRVAASSRGRSACGAALSLARLEAGPAGDLAAAHAAARAALDRFERESDAIACVQEARRMLTVLEDHTTQEERVAARRAHAEHAPASPGSTGRRDGAGVVGEAEVEDWVARQRQAEQQARLEELVVYGADPGGELPLSEREVRVVLRFDGVAVYRRGSLPAQGGLPRRIFLDLDRVELAPRLQRIREVGGGGLQRVRIVELDAETTRVSFDVGETTAYRLFFLSDPYRVVMDFRDQGSVAAAAARRPSVTVVLDPGHGGDQPGAKGPEGLRESDVALSLARRVRAALRRKRSDVRVLLTRDEDRFITLEERTAIANGYDADLFVSIHLNASHSPEDKGGVSTFVLDTTNDEAALRLAARENGTDAAGVTQLQFILASLYREDQVEHSLALAHAVQRATLHAGRQVLPTLYDRGVKKALFYVLVGARMPAVLVEASFITRPEEAKALRTDEYRDALAEGIAAGIVRHLEKSERSNGPK